MALPSIMKHSFSNIPGVFVKGRNSTAPIKLKPLSTPGTSILLLDDILPGDTISLLTTAFGRLATPVFPSWTTFSWTSSFSSFRIAFSGMATWKMAAGKDSQGAQDDPGDFYRLRSTYHRRKHTWYRSLGNIARYLRLFRGCL